jgi:hypothetical protein
MLTQLCKDGLIEVVEKGNAHKAARYRLVPDKENARS